ncbi:hypothetical protein ACFZAD_30300 [Streptomyces iakyrus]
MSGRITLHPGMGTTGEAALVHPLLTALATGAAVLGLAMPANAVIH